MLISKSLESASESANEAKSVGRLAALLVELTKSARDTTTQHPREDL